MDSLGILNKIDFIRESRSQNYRILDYSVYNNDDRKQSLQICGWSQLNVRNQIDESFALPSDEELTQNLGSPNHVRKTAEPVPKSGDRDFPL